MVKTRKPIKTVKDLERAINAAPESSVRACLRRIALEAFAEDDGTLNPDKELGADFIGEVVLHLEASGFKPDEPSIPVEDEGTTLKDAARAAARALRHGTED